MTDFSGRCETELQREEHYAAIRAEHKRRYGQHYDGLSLELLFGLVHTFIAAEARVGERLHEHGLTPPAFNILVLLRHQAAEGIPLNELSRLLLVSRANITGLIDSLERRGLARRQDHPTDRRVILAHITPEGEAWLDRYLPEHFQFIRDMLSGLTDEEKRQALQLLTKLRRTSCRHPREQRQRP